MYEMSDKIYKVNDNVFKVDSDNFVVPFCWRLWLLFTFVSIDILSLYHTRLH